MKIWPERRLRGMPRHLIWRHPGGVLITFCEEKRQRIENRKLRLPVPLDGTEPDTERAMAGKLNAESRHISAVGRINHLAVHCNASLVLTFSVNKLMNAYSTQPMSPSRWNVRSFHRLTGRGIADTVTTAGPQILKTIGNVFTNTAVADRCAVDIQYVSVSFQVDLTSVTGDQKDKYDLNMVIKLPMENSQ